MEFKLVSIDGHRKDASAADEFSGQEYGAYESFRFHQGHVFLLDEHFDRLGKSLSALGIVWDDERNKYYSWIADLCRDTPAHKDVFVRFSVISENEKTQVSIYGAYIDFFSPKSYQAVTLDKTRLDKPEYFKDTGFRIKTADYIKGNLNIRQSDGLDEGIDGILLTPEGYVAEALTANVLWAKAGKLYTPPLNTGILAGTMRAYLMRSNEIEETLAAPEELESADEIILTSGASYLRPLAKVNGRGKPGAEGTVFKKLYAQLIKDVEKFSKALT